MWTLRAAREPGPSRATRQLAFLLTLAFAGRGLSAQPVAAPAAVRASSADAQMILTVRANGVEHGEFTVLRRPDGEFWIRAADLPRLKVEPVEAARREAEGEQWFSFAALGAASVRFDEAQLALDVLFPASRIAGTRIDLSSRPPPVVPTQPRNSLILSYRLAARDAGQGHRAATLDNDLNVRVGPLLLRQETRLDTSMQRRFVRGASQAIWDDRTRAVRYVAGDVLSTAGAYGSAITGAGLLVTKLYDLAPDVIKQPTVSLQTSTALPAQVEVAVDGSTIYRTNVGPGPISLDNLFLFGGSRNLRVTVTDASGRREVIEQPFLFTDSVLAKGLHEYSYFIGKRSELGPSNEWRYREAAWQGYHRYGASDSVTLSGGGEGSAEFVNAGAGITLRSDRLGLISADLLASHDRAKAQTARGWSARYTYPTPNGSFVLGHRQFDEDFRSFAVTGRSFVRRETRAGATARLFSATVGADLARSEDALERRDFAAVRVSTSLTRSISLLGETQLTRVNGRREWTTYVYLRAELDPRHWISTNLRSSSSRRTLDLETGRQIAQGEGFGYRVGSSTSWQDSGSSSLAYGSGSWNLRPVAVDVFANAPVTGGGSRYGEVALSGALVGVDGYWGVTRRVADSFVLARLGVPQAGVEVSVNNQVQGRTDARGQLFIPQVGAFGRQDITINDKQLALEYNVRETRRTIAPAFRSGTVVDFGAHKMHAVAGAAWQLREGKRVPIATRAWEMRGPQGSVKVETASAGDFYLEDVAPGSYRGMVQLDDRQYSCRMSVPEFEDVVLELKEGIVCE